MKDALVESGVASHQILLETRSLTTSENAWETSALLRHQGIQTAIVVTNAWHMRRALADFRLCGMQARALPTDSSPTGLAQRIVRRLIERASEFIDRARLSRGTDS
jgi:uncharacterized SAM-binding protein YcdF (DUF218 family)